MKNKPILVNGNRVDTLKALKVITSKKVDKKVVTAKSFKFLVDTLGMSEEKARKLLGT